VLSANTCGERARHTVGFRNFSIWRGKLPHWRADDVTYYVTFRHRRDLDEVERNLIFRALLKPDGTRWDLLVLCVLPEVTEMMFRVRESPIGRPYELADIVEPAKGKAGKRIVKRTGERWPPFYSESYDRIVRDEAELAERWQQIVDSSVDAGLCEEPDEYPCLYVHGFSAE
jgi:hypothetical protein